MSVYEPNTTFVFGEEGPHCPLCGSRADFGEVVRSRWPAQCLNESCGITFMTGHADPQCGECREFLEDVTAEDDSLCQKCKAES